MNPKLLMAAIWPEIWRYRATWTLGLLSTFAAAGVLLLLPERASTLVQVTLPEGDLSTITTQLGLVLAIAAIGLSLNVARKYLTDRLSHLIARDMRAKLYHHVLATAPHGLRSNELPRITSCFSNDVQVLFESCRALLSTVIPSVLYLVVFSAAMIHYSWILFLSIAILILPVALATNLFARRLHEASDASQSCLARLLGHLDETLRGAKDIKSLVMEPRMGTSFDRLNADSLKSHLKRETYDALHPFVVSMAVALAIATLVILSLLLLKTGWLTSGNLSAFVVCLLLAYPSGQELSHSLGRLVQLGNVLKRIKDVLALPSERSGGLSLERPCPGGAIRFENVDFTYEQGGTVFRGLDLSIPADESVAIVGPSGAGKSTLLELLLRFIEPQAGRILIDGQDIAGLSVADLRRHIGLVRQEPFLFRGTLLENLAMGAPGASRDRIMEAARLAHVDDFARRLPGGYDHPVDAGGANFSVGQRQRIAIARVFLTDPPILLLDEPTSALDAGSEQLVEEAIRTVSKGRTTLIVAHRLSTVRNVDRLIVLDGGQIVESGTHRDLVERGGSYATLYRQSRGLRPASAQSPLPQVVNS